MKALILFLSIFAGTTSSALAADSMVCEHSIQGRNILTISYAERKSGFEYFVTNENLDLKSGSAAESLNLNQLTHSDDALHGDKGLRTLENLEYMAFEIGGTGDYVSISFDEQIIRITDAAGERIGISDLRCEIKK